MEKVEQFIQGHKRSGSNEIAHWDIGGENVKRIYSPWLTLDQARSVAEIAREETIKEVCEWINSHYRDYMHNPTGKQLEAFFGMDMIEDLKKHFENKL